MDSSTKTFWTGLFPKSGCLESFYYYMYNVLCFVEVPVVDANSEDPDQKPHSGASDLGLPCLPFTLLRVS